MRVMAGATTLGNFAGALGVPAEEATIVAELKAGSEEAYTWLIAQFQQPIYSLVYRIVSDPADAADTTQEVFLKVFRGMKRFNGSARLKTWVYRIAVHEASNRKRWWIAASRRWRTSPSCSSRRVWKASCAGSMSPFAPPSSCARLKNCRTKR